MATRSVNFQFLAEPTDVNFGGKVHGGMIMKWIDQVAYACAVGWSKAYCITVSVGAIRFYHPVLVGHLVHLNAKVVHTGNSSIHVFVTVASSDPKTGVRQQTNHCIITFVAMDEQGQLIAAPTWTAQTADDQVLEQYAINMKQMSMAAEQALAQRLATVAEEPN